MNNSVAGATGRSGIYALCVANFDSARVELYIDMGDWGKNKAYFDALLAHRLEIEQAFGEPLAWARSDDTRASRIYVEIKDVSVANEQDWPVMTQFHADSAKRILDAVNPYLNL